MRSALSPFRAMCAAAGLYGGASILRGRLTFTPMADGQGYDFSGPTRFDKLFTGMVCEVPTWLKARESADARRSCEPIDPENTFDGDYGRLLDPGYESSVKVLASPTGTNRSQEIVEAVTIDRWVSI